ncbi:DUF6151 family protein [Litorisediminicola beolgyonensis]|uniref:DUF6151 family protein n=1 Tax=Litorisediminicola beolgyonensis TaxID=1173614 RepID=A0ABW3ZK35_9RHOB
MTEFSCRCGTMAWQVDPGVPGTQVTCYCPWCQAAATHVGASDWLDKAGGTLIRQTLPRALRITKGETSLKAFRLSKKGVLRWYAGCCGTPMANTLGSPALPFVGVILPPGDTQFGRCRNFAFTETAKTKVRQRGMARVAWGVLLRGAMARARGETASPFFEDGQPVRPVEQLDRATRQAAGAP